MSVFGIIITFAFTGNIVFIQCLGWCPILSFPKKTSAAIGSAGAVPIRRVARPGPDAQ